MAINELHDEYPNRNSELRTTAKMMFEYGYTVAKEAAAGHTNGLDEHAIKRQRSYIEQAREKVQALAARPIPDRAATHPIQLPIDFRKEYIYFVEDVNGNEIPINEAAQELAEAWLIAAVELAKSNSASLAGSLVDHDATRAENNIDALEKLVDEIEKRPFLDLPESANPGAAHKPRSGSKSK